MIAWESPGSRGDELVKWDGRHVDAVEVLEEDVENLLNGIVSASGSMGILVIAELSKHWSKQIQPVAKKGSVHRSSPIPHRASHLHSALRVCQRSYKLLAFPSNFLYLCILHIMDRAHPTRFAGPLAVPGGNRQYPNPKGMTQSSAHSGGQNTPRLAASNRNYNAQLLHGLVPPPGLSRPSDATKVSTISSSRLSASPSSSNPRILKQTKCSPQSPSPQSLRPQYRGLYGRKTLKSTAPSSNTPITGIPGVLKHLQRQPASAYPRPLPSVNHSSYLTPSFGASASRGDSTLIETSNFTGGRSKYASGAQAIPSQQLPSPPIQVFKQRCPHHEQLHCSAISSYKPASSFLPQPSSISHAPVTITGTPPSPVVPTSRIPQPILKGNGLRPRSATIKRVSRRSCEPAPIAFSPPPSNADDRTLYSKVEWVFQPVTKEHLATKISSKIKILGRGGQGQVELWRETGTGKPIAVKVTRIGEGTNRRMLKSKKMEVDMLERLRQDDGSWHQCMSAYGEVVYAPQRSQLLQFAEYIEGYTMHRHQRLFTLEAIKAFLVQAVSGLQYIHSKGIIHRDIKPPNFMLTHNGIVKYIDFGLALPQEASDTILAKGAGTPGFLAPEVEVHGLPCTTKIDIWAIGISIIDFMKSELPEDALDTEVIKPAGWWPPELKDFLSRCIEKSPNLRASAGELLQHPFVKGKTSNKELLRMYKPKRVNAVKVATKKLEKVVRQWMDSR